MANTPKSPRSLSGKSSSRLNKKKGGKKKAKRKSPKPGEYHGKTREELKAIAKQYTRLVYRITKEAIKLAEHLQKWVDKNSQPKKIDYAKLGVYKPEVSRWAKRGPMTRRDWLRFYNWAAKNAVAKAVQEPPPPEPPQKKKRKPGEEEPTFEEMIENLDRLADPKNPRKKYEYPKPDYAYAPQINLKVPPKKDKGRPFKTVDVPKDFQHIINELDFWYKVRFPVRPAALSYVPSANIVRLALPRIRPPPHQHCPIPEKPIEFVPPRRKMTYRQWRAHQRRLIYLAEPVYRPVYEDLNLNY